jgi:hypothetical protein
MEDGIDSQREDNSKAHALRLAQKLEENQENSREELKIYANRVRTGID